MGPSPGAWDFRSHGFCLFVPRLPNCPPVPPPYIYLALSSTCIASRCMLCLMPFDRDRRRPTGVVLHEYDF